jgi:hypothetical protein
MLEYDMPSVVGETRLVYIGDGVYASHDGYHIWLRTRREYRWESIALEPNVIKALGEYIESLSERQEATNDL